MSEGRRPSLKWMSSSLPAHRKTTIIVEWKFEVCCSFIICCEDTHYSLCHCISASHAASIAHPTQRERTEKYATAESIFKNKIKCQELWEWCSVVGRWGCGPRPCSPSAWSWPMLPSSSVILWVRTVTAGSSGKDGRHPFRSVQCWYTTRFWDTRYIGHINGSTPSSFHSFESIK